MNITEQKTGEHTALLKMEVAESDYAEKYQNELKNYRRQASMPGFRPGKVPMGLIQKKVGISIMVEEVNKIVSENLDNYIKKNDTKIMGYPLANTEKEPQDFQRQKDFTFYFDVAYLPEIDLKLNEFDPVDYLKIKVDDKKLDEQIDEIRTRDGSMTEQDEVAPGDMIYVNISELDEDGNIKEDGISKDTMILVDYLKKEEVKDQVIGSKVGDLKIFNPLDATGSEAETASMLGIDKEVAAGIKNDFQFEITKIERSTPAELGEEFYQKAFPKDEIKTEEEFREKVREQMSKAFTMESERLFSRYAMDRIYDQTEINLPDEFLKKWLYVSNEGKVSMEAIEKNYDGYRKAMKMDIIENNLIHKKNDLRVTDNDLKNEIRKYFKGYFMPNQDEDAEVDPETNQQLDKIAENYLEKNDEEARRIHDELFSRRLADYLKNEMKLNEKEVTYDEFVKEIDKITGQDHDHDHGHDHDHDHDHNHDHDHSHETDDHVNEQ